MKRLSFAVALVLLTIGTNQAFSQKWSIGGNMGLSLYDGSAGFHIATMSEYFMNKSFAIGGEFALNTHAGTPLTLFLYPKYYFNIAGSKIRPYADAGPVLMFVTGGPYFGIQFGGGVTIPIANRLLIAPDLQLGPVFGFGGGTYNYFGTTYKVEGKTIFGVLIRCGIRYEIP